MDDIRLYDSGIPITIHYVYFRFSYQLQSRSDVFLTRFGDAGVVVIDGCCGGVGMDDVGGIREECTRHVERGRSPRGLPR